jgi:hypothetical protein
MQHYLNLGGYVGCPEGGSGIFGWVELSRAGNVQWDDWIGHLASLSKWLAFASRLAMLWKGGGGGGYVCVVCVVYVVCAWGVRGVCGVLVLWGKHSPI